MHMRQKRVSMWMDCKGIHVVRDLKKAEEGFLKVKSWRVSEQDFRRYNWEVWEVGEKNEILDFNGKYRAVWDSCDDAWFRKSDLLAVTGKRDDVRHNEKGPDSFWDKDGLPDFLSWLWSFPFRYGEMRWCLPRALMYWFLWAYWIGWLSEGRLRSGDSMV